MQKENSTPADRSAFILASDGKTALEKCALCRMCELVCSIRHYGVANPRRSSIRIEYDGTSEIKPRLCTQCRTHPCVPACPRGALVVDAATSVYAVDPDKCDGCQDRPKPLCVEACPVRGALRLDPVELKILKCDLCGGDPACVEICYAGVLKIVDLQKGTRKTFKGVENISTRA